MRTKVIFVLATTIFLGCEPKPEAIRLGTDSCAECKMTISDERFGGEIITAKGRVYKFDDIVCLQKFRKKNPDCWNIYVIDFETKKWIEKNKAHYFFSNELRTPMNGNVIAVANNPQLNKLAKLYHGNAMERSKVFE